MKLNKSPSISEQRKREPQSFGYRVNEILLQTLFSWFFPRNEIRRHTKILVRGQRNRISVGIRSPISPQHCTHPLVAWSLHGLHSLGWRPSVYSFGLPVSLPLCPCPCLSLFLAMFPTSTVFATMLCGKPTYFGGACVWGQGGKDSQTSPSLKFMTF